MIGGGLSGLSVTWHLAHLVPDARIVLYEAAPRWGGWLHSVRVPVPGSDTGILFELGPRTLRPSGAPGLATLQLVHALGIESDVLMIPKTSPAARDRFLYTDGRLQRLGLPMFRRSAFDMAKGLLLNHKPNTKGASAKGAPSGFDDETIYDFFARRFGPRLADTMATAMVHGIYSGDARQLSLRSTFRSIFLADRRAGRAWDDFKAGKLARGWKELRPDDKGIAVSDPVQELEAAVVERMAAKDAEQALPWRKPEAGAFAAAINKEASIYTFKEGISYLSDMIVRDIRRKFPNVELKVGDNVASISPDASGALAVSSESGSTELFSHVTAAVPSSVLASMLPRSRETTELRDLLNSIEFSTVAVVNLAYEGKPEDLLPVQGFGFLVPLKDMLADSGKEPLDALGVIFDSCAAGAQDQGVTPNGKPITRLTVMMGGHAFGAKFGDPDRADANVLLERARNSVRRALFPNGEPELVASQVTVQKNCIPQYQLGHDLKLAEIKAILDDPRGPFGGKLSVCHASYIGVSMNDCIMYGRELAVRLAAAQILDAGSLSGLFLR